MASVFFTPSFSLLREHSKFWSTISLPRVLPSKDHRFHHCCVRAVSKKKSPQIDPTESPSGDDVISEEGAKVSKRSPRRTRKKIPVDEVSSQAPEIAEDPMPKKISKRGRKKATEIEASGDVSASEGEKTEKKTARRRKTKKKSENSDSEVESDIEIPPVEDEDDDLLLLKTDSEVDSSFVEIWPPLICCFGAVQHGFIPCGRPANRLIDHEIHETKKDMFWSPDKFFRSPGSSASNVALALANLGARVEVMGKLGDDDYGRTLLYHLNSNHVQTRSIKIDSSKLTSFSRMKLARRGTLKSSCTKASAEDSFLVSEINVDVLREAKMFYFNSSSLLNENLRKTTMRAIRVSKMLGGTIFFDLNLALPLWESKDETKAMIKEAWECADIIEITKQELEFLAGIDPIEEFDTKNNARSKFLHHKHESVKSLWHKDLKVIFVTNGTSKIHYYTENEEGWVRGMEDAPITPFTGEMSASGDAIVAALMKMISVQPDLTTDREYLHHMCKYAITCGIIDQWTAARVHGFPLKEGFEGVLDGDGVRTISEKEFRTVVSEAN